jgi:multicomponent Na+:H+ antiporter subunit D
MDASVLVPLPVGLPLVVAAFLAALTRIIPRRLADLLALATTTAVGVICGALIHYSSIEPIVYWFGGWTPRAGIALGISFVAGPIGSGLATMVCVLVFAALLFSWRYFDTIGTLFHVLMLVFLAAMCGFCLTGDLFNLFVFFELMSAAAYALCGYKIEEAGPLQGALNFAVSNTIGAFLALSGIALLYGRTGALNMAQIGRSLGGQPDGLITTAFVFIACGFLVKAAAFPFHFWLADAHAVAPTPVCVLFSGVMVELGVYAVARVYWSVLDMPFASQRPAVRGLLLGVGVVTALLGAIMCYAQRHLKRLLAFSTVSHIGLLIVAVALLEPTALAGAAMYTVGHGLVKATLFICSGVLLHRLGSVDELELHGKGLRMHGTAVVFVLAGLGLAGLPPFPTFWGEASVDEAAKNFGHDWIHWIFFFAATVTAAAVFRVAGRVFGGIGPVGRKDHTGAGYIEEHRETAGPHRRVPASMWIPAALLTLLALAIGLVPHTRHAFGFAAAEMTDYAGYQARVLDGARGIPVAVPRSESPLLPSIYRGIASASLALVLAAFALSRHGLKQNARTGRPFRIVMRPLRAVHSGHIGDYVAFLTFGVAAYGGILALLLRLFPRK